GCGSFFSSSFSPNCLLTASRIGLSSVTPKYPRVTLYLRSKSQEPSMPVEFTTGIVVSIPARMAATNASIVTLRQDTLSFSSTMRHADPSELPARFIFGSPDALDNTQAETGFVSG